VQTQQNDTAQDRQLVTDYQTAVTEFGQNSTQAQDAFKAIFDRYYKTIKSFAYNKRNDYAEELTQETLLTVWQRLSSGRENITYLRGLVSHSFRCEYADLADYQQHRPNPLSLDREQENEGSTTLLNLVGEDEIQFSATIAQDLLNQLPNRYRLAWEGKLAGKSYKEIAEEQGWNENIVKKYINKGKQLLQGMVAA